MNSQLHHILVPVDFDDSTLCAQHAALHLASGSGAMVTLIHVDDRRSPIDAAAQLDAVEYLHQVMLLPASSSSHTPGYPSPNRQLSLSQLQAMREALAADTSEQVQIRVVCREGDTIDELRAYIDEAGVDVVVMPSPQFGQSPILQRATRALSQRCPCQLQIVCPPYRPPAPLPSRWSIIWDLLRARFVRPAPACATARTTADAG